MSDLYLKPKMLQICIVGRDCERLNVNWGKLLGKKFAGLSRYEKEATRPTEYHGKMVPELGMETNTYDLAADGKSIQFEILGALNGPSEWYNFMSERHQGIHHIAFEMIEDDLDRGLVDIERNTGIGHVQKGSPYSSPEAGYAYLDTKKRIGTTMEILSFGKMGEATRHYREVTAQMSGLDDKSAPLAAMIPSNVTLVVEDIERSVCETAALFHVEAPEIVTQTIKETYYGYEADSVIRTAEMDMESTVLRFLEPVSGDDAWANFSREARCGVYSIAYDVADLKAKCGQMAQFGLSVLQYGAYADGTQYVLLDGRKDYAAVIELRTSEAIRSKLAQKKASEAPAIHSEFAINEMTPIKEVIEGEARSKVWEKHFPGTLDRIRANMAIAYRMPLGMVLKMSGKMLSEEAMLELLKELNQET